MRRGQPNTLTNMTNFADKTKRIPVAIIVFLTIIHLIIFI
ncbi:hypothetical protein ADIS_2484 [Lunatimonas lonarensis]|uniref:Uncharacterized protein n=1 Tax=Lunatimonas lonarensis TaxID=1232681 RepID=R7ZSF2_9BACT|nr:hypothetical protein ADIS_2484 [Lunatimonas lonarensis]